MKMLGKVITLIAQIVEDDLGVIFDVLERLVAQQKKGENNFLCKLKQFLRDDVKSFLVPCSGIPFGARFNTKILQNLTQPDCEFDESNFELVICESGLSIKDFHDKLILRGRMPVNANFVSFLYQYANAFPNSWKNETILVTGTWYVGRNQFVEDKPCVCMMRYSTEHRSLSCQNIDLHQLTNTDEFILCYKE